MGLVLLVGCTEPAPTDDLSDDRGYYDTVGWSVAVNFDQFPNIAWRCIGSDKAYTTTRIALPLIIVPNSADCRDGAS